jgi:small subunit ribosomal protein S20
VFIHIEYRPILNGANNRMPNRNSAKKRVRTSEKNRVSNKSVKTRLATTRKNLLAVIESGDLAESTQKFNDYSSQLDKAVKKNIIKANAADRRKSRIALRLKSLS